MLSTNEYQDVRRLHGQGWSISAIARHLGRDRKTVRRYLSGNRKPGVRTRAEDVFLSFHPYCRLRLADDPHLPATALFDEITDLGYRGGYSTFTRALRRHRLRPPCSHCHPCAPGGGPGGPPTDQEEIRFGWTDLADARPGWDGSAKAHLLTGSLRHAGRWRGVLLDSDDFPQVLEAVDHLLRRLGGTAPRWRFDSAVPVRCPATGRLAKEFATVGRYYGVEIELETAGPTAEEARRAAAAGQHWRSVVDDLGPRAAQQILDRLATWSDDRLPADEGAPHAAPPLEPLPPAPFPACVRTLRTVDQRGLVHFRGNRYAVPPDLAGALVEVRHRLDESGLSITAASGAVIARHSLAPRGAGRTVVDGGSVFVLERPPRLVLPGSAGCPATGVRSPLSAEASAEAEALRRRYHRPGPAAPVRRPSGAPLPG
ncbi:Mu transposase domain-containing protein [Kitasatospora sp. DSM 101779]|uniref:Mu transposase domain-containing protein n=1 Tax=Kitasatospora sp. DSM 101779 TaxID=2853165 RepID=UPI0021D99D6C|nr:helix-turn-helix domain-containing protein [Kitasatospora sp. DSM 101779]MCU7825012.1 helix-turn-helix domain-containing protein [Kitasatospora sp. DSM 101779]